MARSCTITSAVGGFLWLLVVAVAWGPGGSAVAARSRRPEMCSGGRALGDKWFDGCQWCVCTARGAHCSQSQCSSLARQVAPCHEVGQKFRDGCYRCRCKRSGIVCRMETVCLLLRHNPVPCLSDSRCVCGPDGVPSCTAHVIDRHAYAAKTIGMGIPGFIPAEAEVPRSRHHHDTSAAAGSEPRMLGDTETYNNDDFRSGGSSVKLIQALSGRNSREGKEEEEEEEVGGFKESQQELLITSDNLCRFGPRWYGGSLRCFCDLDGSIACGNPTFVSAFFDDFGVERHACEEGHVWEEGCSVCTCRVNGVVFCRYDLDCRHHHHNRRNEHHDHPDDDNDINDDEDNAIDHYLPGFKEDPDEGLGGLFMEELPRPTRLPLTKSTARAASLPPPRVDCMPGVRWMDGCRLCHCDHRHRAVCHRRLCDDNNLLGEDGDFEEEEEEDSSGGSYNHLHKEGEMGREEEGEEEEKEEKSKPHHIHHNHHGKSRHHDDQGPTDHNLNVQKVKERHHDANKPKNHNHHSDRTDSSKDTSNKDQRHNHHAAKPDEKKPGGEKEPRRLDNRARERPATMKPLPPRGSRGPTMMVPKPAAIFRPPAFSRYKVHGPGAKPSPCGDKLKVGQIFWKECNLCLCTPKGAKCQGKYCW